MRITSAIVATAGAVLALGIPAPAQASRTAHVVTPHTGTDPTYTLFDDISLS